MAFKYILDKSSKKYRCSRCNKNTLVAYIDIETNNLMPLEFGRCDREQNCGYLNVPNNSFIKEVEYKFNPPLEPSYLDIELIQASGRNFKSNNFIQFLKTLFTEAQIKEVILKYLIGTSNFWSGATVFWQLDNNNNLRHGKVMLYNSETGKRQKNKDGKPYINSVKSILKLKDFNLNQCLFGLHLINETNSKTVAIVESEKTAIIMSLFKPEYVWLASGSKSGFKYEYLMPLRNFKIIGFPDKSEYYDWQNKADELNKLGFKISISDYLEKTNYKDGSDLADIYINEANKQILEPQIIEVNTDKTVKDFIKKNNNLKLLINTFDLVDYNGINLKT